MNLRYFVIVAFLILSMINCTCIDLTGYSYKILSLKINGIESLSEFSLPHRLNIWDNHPSFPGEKKISILKKKTVRTGLAVQYPDWDLDKDNCRLIITDTLQNIFSGVYTITEIPHSPMRYQLKSDSIEILMERLVFTIEKPYLDIPLFDTMR